MTALAAVPAAKIAAAIADAAARWADADFPPRVRLLDRIAARTGYSVPVVEYALDQIFFSVTERDLHRTIAGELGAFERLDGFHDGRAAMPAGSVAIISSRTTIGVAIVPAVFALCSKCDVTVKDREDGLISAFFASLGAELPEFTSAATASIWNGERDEHGFEGYDVVAAFGSEQTIAAIASKLRAGARLLAYGPKASTGYISADALPAEQQARGLAERAARDVVLYDTEGCLSLHAVFVQDGGTIGAADFARLLAAAMERAAVEFPPGLLDVHGRTRVAQARDLAAFRSAGGKGAAYSDREASYLVLFDPPRDEPPPFLARTVAVFGVGNIDEAGTYLRAHGIAVEAIAVAGTQDGVAALARANGASRICSFGDLQRPPLHHPHGGIGRILPYVRWIGNG